jgi:hypothetical protein
VVVYSYQHLAIWGIQWQTGLRFPFFVHSVTVLRPEYGLERLDQYYGYGVIPKYLLHGFLLKYPFNRSTLSLSTVGQVSDHLNLSLDQSTPSDPVSLDHFSLPRTQWIWRLTVDADTGQFWIVMQPKEQLPEP